MVVQALVDMSKARNKPWGIWVTTSKEWMMNSPTRKARYEFKREAAKEADEFNHMWKGRKHVYEARKIK